MFSVPNEYRIGNERSNYCPLINQLAHLRSSNDLGVNGAFILPCEGKSGFFFLCIASSGMGWEHVSVSIPTERRCPTWEEMCYIKSVFWDNNDAVMQLHPPKSDWVNNHPYCLHLWRPVNQPIPLPHSIMVGAKALNTTANTTS